MSKINNKDLPTAHLKKNIVYLLSDQNTDKSLLYQFLGEDQHVQPNCMHTVLAKIPKAGTSSNNKFQEVVEIYSFPDDRITKNQSQLYFDILSFPSLIMYYLNTDSTVKQFLQWMDQIQYGLNSIKTRVSDENAKQNLLLQQRIQDQILHQKPSPKLVFISNAKTYTERKQVINKLSPYFSQDVTQHIFFIQMDQNSLYTLLFNFSKTDIGLKLSSFVRRINFVSKIKWAINNFIQNRRKPANSII